MLASSFTQSLVNLNTKFLLRDYPDIGTTTAKFFRGIIMMLLSLLYFRLKEINLLYELKKVFTKLNY